MGFTSSQFSLTVAGQNITSRVSPLLQSLTVKDAIGSTSDTCTIVLNDTDGEIALPDKGDPIFIMLGGKDGMAEVFRGTVDEVRCDGSKRAGRTMHISGKGIDTTGKVKEPKQKHKDKTTFGAVAKEWGGEAGLQVQVHGSLASIQRDYWSMRGESFMHWGRRMADELGAVFKVSGDRAVFVPANEDQTASGQGVGSVSAVWGENCIKYDVIPVVGRPEFKKSTVRYFDKESGSWKTEEVEVEGSKAKPGQSVRYSSANKGNSKDRAKSESKKSKRRNAGGSITILGDPSAKAGGKVTLVGARPGIDGEYTMKMVTHSLSKSGGYTTDISLERARGAAGSDSRAKKKK